MVGVEDRRFAPDCDCLLQRRYAELGVHSVRYPPRQDLPRIEVDDRDEVHIAALQADVGDVRRPYLVWEPDVLASQQVGILLVALGRDRRPLPCEYRPKAGLLHDPAHLLEGHVLVLDGAPDLAVAIERPFLEFVENCRKNGDLAIIF